MREIKNNLDWRKGEDGERFTIIVNFEILTELLMRRYGHYSLTASLTNPCTPSSSHLTSRVLNNTFQKLLKLNLILSHIIFSRKIYCNTFNKHVTQDLLKIVSHEN